MHDIFIKNQDLVPESYFPALGSAPFTFSRALHHTNHMGFHRALWSHGRMIITVQWCLLLSYFLCSRCLASSPHVRSQWRLS